jgi:hypothetical protein
MQVTLARMTLFCLPHIGLPLLPPSTSASASLSSLSALGLVDDRSVEFLLRYYRDVLLLVNATRQASRIHTPAPPVPAIPQGALVLGAGNTLPAHMRMPQVRAPDALTAPPSCLSWTSLERIVGASGCAGAPLDTRDGIIACKMGIMRLLCAAGVCADDMIITHLLIASGNACLVVRLLLRIHMV